MFYSSLKGSYAENKRLIRQVLRFNGRCMLSGIVLTTQLTETFKVDEINQTVYIIGFSHG